MIAARPRDGMPHLRLASGTKTSGCGCRKKDNQKFKPDFDAVAKVVFSSPSFASVGLTEEEAVEQEKDVDVFTSEFT